MAGKTQKFYDRNPAARAKKAEYQKSFNAKPENIKKRSELNAYNRKSQASGRTSKYDNLDASHTKSGIRFKHQSVNRGSKKDQSGDRRARGGRK